MNKYIALLRGINVGGRRKILMVDLRELIEDLGGVNVQTYIQSGNVIFEYAKSRKKGLIKELEQKIHQAIKDKYDFEVPILIRTVEEWKTTFEENPYLKNRDAKIEQLIVTFLADLPEEEQLANFKELDYPPDECTIIAKDLFLFCGGKYHKTKFSNNFIEKKLKVAATTRNWKTVTKLMEMVKASPKK